MRSKAHRGTQKKTQSASAHNTPMSETLPPTLNPTQAPPADPDSLAAYAERAYLEYALSVVKGRASA